MKRNLYDTFKESAELRKRFFLSLDSSPEITSEVLSTCLGKKVDKAVVEICKEMTSVSHPIPWPSTKEYAIFRDLYGSTHRHSKVKTIGCYVLTTTNGSNYVGQSVHVSNRIRIRLF